MMEKNRKNTLGLILAAVVLFIYFFKASAWSEVRSWSERRDISNIMLYMIGIILFFVVAIIGSWIENRIIPHIKNAWYVERVAAMLLLIGGGITCIGLIY